MTACPAAPLRYRYSRGDMASVAPFARWDAEDGRCCLGTDASAGRVPALPPRFACFMPGVDLFDAQAFGISPAEAVTMDPQQRLILQARVSYTSTWAAGADNRNF